MKLRYFDMGISFPTKFDGTQVIKAIYSKNSGRSSDPGVGGFFFKHLVDPKHDGMAAASWDVWYPENFDFAKGGKFGGFTIGYGHSSGYRHSDTGSSHRVMWTAEGGVISYIYPPSNLPQEDPTLLSEGHGISYFEDNFKNILKKGTWNTITVGVKMNTFKDGVPNPDGCALVVANGKRMEKCDIRWSMAPRLKIRSFDWNTFFGGPDPSPKDQFAYFKNFQFAKYSS